jgi:hypothetical protein
MKKISFILLSVIIYQVVAAQSPVNRQQFFLDDRLIEATLSTDIKNLRSSKKKPLYQPANIVMHFSDTAVINEEIRVETRGQFRKENCDIASLMLNFKNQNSPKLSPLKKLKLVGGCRSSHKDEELLLKEYLAYKIYNFLTNMSFRVRLLHITYKDTRDKMKSYTQYAFLIEDMNDMAARNNCSEIKKVVKSNALDSRQLALVCMFQYLISNTDWSIPNFHNIKLMVPKNDTLAMPYIVPYDFDYSGLVNAEYAVPNEQFTATTVTERVYRGFPQSLEELQVVLDKFKEKKEAIMYSITNFTLLGEKTKKEMIKYLDEFYDIINSKRSVRSTFNVQ